MKNIKNFLLIFFSFFAIGPMVWAQQINVNSVTDLTNNDVEHLFSDDYGDYYKFCYMSTDVAGNPVRLSSLLAFRKSSSPSDVNNSVLINCHYTITANSQCPTNIKESIYDLEYPDHVLLYLLFSGNSTSYNELISKSVIIMPDYEGYGVSADRTHLYLAEELTAKQVVDAVSCGMQLYQELVNSGDAPQLASDWCSFSMGYSQGGAVALAVHRYIEQHNLSNTLRFRGSLCGDGPYDLIATLRYYMEDDGESCEVSTNHRARQATLPVVLPMILKGMIDSEPALAGYQISDYLVQDFLDTGILEWLNSKSMTNAQIATAWLQQLQSGSTTVNDITYSAPATMSQMFSPHGNAPWVDLRQVFTPDFYSYLTDVNNYNSVPTNPTNAYQAMHLALANNNLCIGWNPGHRIQFMHSKHDMVVPYGNYLAFRDAHPSGEDSRYQVNIFSTDDHQTAGTTFMMRLGQMGEYLHWLDESPLEWSGSGTENNPYLIGTAEEWSLLCSRVNVNGYNYAGTYFKMIGDISISETFSSRPTQQVGHGENVNFRGIFDGNGHTMTINYVDNNDEDYCAPFRYIRNATIKNLHVAGSIAKTHGKKAGGLVGVAFGTCHITNCRSSVDIYMNLSGDCSSGGFIGELDKSSDTDDTYLENCLFDGKLTGTNASKWGGFIGWVKDEPAAYFTNCLFNPSEVNINSNDSKTFARTDNSDDVHVSNCYYKRLINDAQGGINASGTDNEPLRAALGDGWEIVTEDGVDKVAPIMGPRALNGEGTPASPYLIANNGDWHALATNVYFGETYSGKCFQMTSDIGVGRMVGTYTNDDDYKAFSGIFDGGGHTVTFTTSTSSEYCAPFRCANGATFQNLKVTGAITTSSQFAAGFVGYVKGNGCTFNNCESNITIDASTDGDGTHGGFVANIAGGSNVFEGCAFTGSLLGTSTHSCGGFVGWTDGRYSDGAVDFTNCLYRPTSNTMGNLYNATFARGRDNSITTDYGGNNPSNITFSNCYYTAAFGLTQGKQARSITTGENAEFTLAFVGDATAEYNVSGLSIYGTGLQYGDVLYAGNADAVSLNLVTTPGYSVSNATYTPEGGTATPIEPDAEGAYSFTMPDANVTINGDVNVMDWEGDGSEATPYLIYYPVQLDLLAGRVNAPGLNEEAQQGYSGKYFKVMADLAYDGTAGNYTAVGYDTDHKFNGRFDGQGYTISGINSIPSGTVPMNGIFGCLGSGAEVKNIILNSSTIGDGEDAGGIAGRNEGTVTGCHVLDDVTIIGASQSSTCHGGVVGANMGTVSNCVFEGTLTKTFTDPSGSMVNGYYYGGVAGYNEGSLTDNLVMDATIPVTMHFYGAVAGNNDGGTLARNYYINCTVAGIANATNVGISTYSNGYQRTDVTESDGAVPGQMRVVAGYGESDGGYALIATPFENVDPANVAGMTDGGFDLYRFNQAADLEWENWKQEGGNYHFNLETGRGYLYAHDTGITLVFTGEPYSGNGEVTLSKTNNADAGFQGWNLVGNPFMETAYIADGRDFYVMRDDGSEIITSETNAIAPMEGVFVIANTDGETLAFTATEPENGNSKGLTLNLSSGHGIIDRAIVRFGEGGMLPKFQIRENSTKVYIPQDGNDYAVVSVGRDAARHVSAMDDNVEGDGVHTVSTIPVNFKAAEIGTYTISVNLDDVDVEYLHLVDNMTGADVDLLAMNGGDASHCVSTYTFEAKTTDYASRFKLVFSICGDANGDNETFAYISNGNIIVDGEGMLQVIDMTGRIIVSRDGVRHVSTNGMVPGVYVLRLIKGDEVKTQKIVLE